MTEPRESRPANNSEQTPDANRNKLPERSLSELRGEFTPIPNFKGRDEDTSSKYYRPSAFSHPDYPGVVFRTDIVADMDRGEKNARATEAVLRGLEQSGINVVPHRMDVIPTSDGHAEVVIAVPFVENAVPLVKAMESGSLSDAAHQNADKVMQNLVQNVSGILASGGIIDSDKFTTDQFMVKSDGSFLFTDVGVNEGFTEAVAADPNIQSRYETIASAILSLTKMQAEYNQATGRELEAAGQELEGLVSSLPPECPHAIKDMAEHALQAVRDRDPSVIVDLVNSWDEDEVETPPSKAWAEHISNLLVRTADIEKFRSLEAALYFLDTGKTVEDRDLTPQELEIARNAAQSRGFEIPTLGLELEGIKAPAEGKGSYPRELELGQAAREKDGPEGEGLSRGDDEEGGSGVPAGGPEGPAPDPVLPQAPGVLPAEQQEQVPEKERDTRGQGEQVGPSGDTQEREPGGDTAATPEQDPSDTPRPGLTEEEVRQQRAEQARIAHELAVELAIAAERGEIPADLAAKVEKFFGLEKDGAHQGQTPEVERDTPQDPEQLAQLREAEKAVQDALAKAERDRELGLDPQNFIRNIEHTISEHIPLPERNPTIEPPTPGQELARLAREDALNPPIATSREREKGFFSGLFSKKERKGSEIQYEPGGMKPLPDLKNMTPKQRAAHDHQLAMTRMLQERGVDFGAAQEIAQGLSVGGMAAQNFAEAVDRRTAEIAAELAAARTAREGQKPKGKDDRELADRAAREARAEVLGAIAEGANETKRAEQEKAQAQDRAAREAYDRENPSQAQSVQEIARLIESSHETPEQRDKRIEAIAIQNVRTQGLDERDPQVLRNARELAEQEDRDRQGRSGRGRGSSGAKGQAREQDGRGQNGQEQGK